MADILTDSYTILRRDQRLVNTDSQRRCYNGCHYSSALVWTDWEELDSGSTLSKAESRLKFWTELNDYAVSQRGKGAKSEFKIQEIRSRLPFPEII